MQQVEGPGPGTYFRLDSVRATFWQVLPDATTLIHARFLSSYLLLTAQQRLKLASYLIGQTIIALPDSSGMYLCMDNDAFMSVPSNSW